MQEKTSKSTAAVLPQFRTLRQLRDAVLAEDLRDLLAHDRRTAHLDLDIRVDGAIAHVQGTVQSQPERQLLRRLLRRPAGLCAVWDLLALPDEELAIVDLGCGGTKQVQRAVGVDRYPQPGVDVVADLEAPLPFADARFDHVFAVHVLEHIRDLLALMAEIHRILRPGGVLHLLAPNWTHDVAVADPTHVRMLSVQTFKFFCEAHSRVPLWRPLSAATSDDTIYVDLEPVKHEPPTSREELARCFR